MGLKGTNQHSSAADAVAMADWSERLSAMDTKEAKSLRDSLEARLELAKVVPEIFAGDPDIAALIGSSENLHRGLSPFAPKDTLNRVRDQLRGTACEVFGNDMDSDLGDLNLNPDDHSNSLNYARLYCDALRAGGVNLSPEVDHYFPKAQASSSALENDLDLDMSEVS